MAAYNAEKYISEAIQSILDQTYTDFELIIVNDGSTDTTKEKIKAFDDPRIKYYENEGNIGLTKTKFKLIDVSNGHFIAIMDADDFSFSKRLELQINEFEKNENLGLCGTWAEKIDSEGKILNEKIKIKEKKLELYPSLLFWNRFIHPSVMIRKECFDYFNYDINAGSAEDLDLWLNISKKYEIINIRKILLKYRIHGSQITTSQKDKVNLDRNKVLFKHTKILFEDTFNEKNHEYLVDWSTPFNIENFNGLHNYCLKLIEHNKIKKIFKVNIFKGVIHKRMQKRILRIGNFSLNHFFNYILFLFKNKITLNLVDIYIFIFKTKKTKWN